jgi:hypothetical protein
MPPASDFIPLSQYRMPSRQIYVGAYDPDVLRRMGTAFDRSWNKLSRWVVEHENNRRNLAILIILHVDRGERDSDRLSDLATADYKQRFRSKLGAR